MNTGPASAGPSPSNVGASSDVDTHVKAEMGAAALERVVAAARAAQEEHQRNTEDLRAVCDLCNVRRADLRGPCGHKYHARCIYSMPITRCPVCDQEFGPDEGLFILPVEPYSAGMLFGDDDRRGREDQHQTRIGRWHTYETMYAQRIVADFEAGTMPLSEGTKLGTFLCNILNCSPSRLSKKLKIGKKYFQRCPDRPMGEEHIAKHREAQKRLSELEEMFLMAESQTNRGIANTQLLSERIQTEWRERFIGHAHTVNQKLKNAWDWNSSRKKADLSAGALSKLLGSITPQKAELAVNSLAPFFLVTHNPNGGGSSATGSGSGTPQLNTSNATLGQAVIDNMLQQHTMRLFSPPTNVRSALGIPPQQALPSGVEPSVDGSVPFGSPSHQPFPSALAAARQAQHSAQQSPRREAYDSKPAPFDWFEQPLPCGQQQQHGQGTPMQTPAPHTQQHVPTPDGMGDITGFGEMWNSLGQDLAALGYNNRVLIGDMDQEPLDNVSSQWLHIHGQNQGSFGETAPPTSSSSTSSSLHDPTAFFMGGSSAASPGSMTGVPPSVTVRDIGRGNPRPGWPSNPLGGAGNMVPGAGGAAGGNPGGGSGGGNPGGSGGNPGGGNGGGGDGGGSGGPPNDEGGDDGDNEDEGSHRFEDFIGNFLDQIPFEAVDVWVPLCNQDQEGSEVVLFHAGYFTNVKELEEWGEYSTNFSFRQGQGLPGRVYGSNESEWQEDVNTLGHVNFLRLNGARNIGIRTSFGVPVVSRWGVTFVIVFYSRTTVQVDNDMKAFIERTVSAWKFDATVDTDACPRDATPSAAKPGAMRA